MLSPPARPPDSSTCTMSEWIAWSPCSASCGPGSRTRSRYMMQFPDDGSPCSLPTEETDGCLVNDECCEFSPFPSSPSHHVAASASSYTCRASACPRSAQQLPGYRVGRVGRLQRHLRRWHEDEGAQGGAASRRWQPLRSGAARSGEVHDA